MREELIQNIKYEYLMAGNPIKTNLMAILKSAFF